MYTWLGHLPPSQTVDISHITTCETFPQPVMKQGGNTAATDSGTYATGTAAGRLHCYLSEVKFKLPIKSRETEIKVNLTAIFWRTNHKQLPY